MELYTTDRFKMQNRLPRTPTESVKFELVAKRIATLFTVDSNRRAFSFLQSAVCLHNGLYLATIRARACSIIDFASFHGQKAARAQKTARRRNARHSASESPRRQRTMDGYSSFHFLDQKRGAVLVRLRMSFSRQDHSRSTDGSCEQLSYCCVSN